MIVCSAPIARFSSREVGADSTAVQSAVPICAQRIPIRVTRRSGAAWNRLRRASASIRSSAFSSIPPVNLSGMRCYVASPLGFTAAGRHWYADVLLPALAPVVEVVDPWALATPEEVEAGADSREFWLSLGARNEEAIRSCSLLVALLDGQELDSGTAAEVGFAAALGLRCFGLRTDMRASGDLGMTVNLQVESFIVESGGFIAPSLRALRQALARWAESRS